MKDNQLIDLFQKARGNTGLAVIEGVQALKHAVRFEAKLQHIITYDINTIEALLAELAPDISQKVLLQTRVVDRKIFDRLSPKSHRTKVIALAPRKSYQLKDLVVDRPVVVLEAPRDLENIGAVIRVAAAADAAGVLITGSVDIWHPAVIRGAAGLHFALPVMNIAENQIVKLGRPLISLDPTGEETKAGSIAKNAALIFGTERHGISQQLLDQSNQITRLPMKPGVSSLNLATSVAATLYRM